MGGGDGWVGGSSMGKWRQLYLNNDKKIHVQKLFPVLDKQALL